MTRGDFATSSQEWEDMLSQSPSQKIFLTPQWHQLCWENLCGQSCQLHLLTVRSGLGPIGIAPLKQEGGTLSFIGSVEVSDYLDFVLQAGEEEIFYRALLRSLADLSWEALELHCLPANSPTLHYLPLLAREQGFSASLEVEEFCPAIDLPPTWEGYLARLHKKERHELRRKMRRLVENATYRYYALEGEELAAGMDDFFRLHRVSTGPKAAFMDNQMERFFRALTTHLASRDWVRLYFLEVDGVRASTALCFQYGQEVLLYNSGFDPAYRSLSVGLLLKAFCIQDAIREGKKRFDFLRGSEHYKYDLGGMDMPIYRCLVQRG